MANKSPGGMVELGAEPVDIKDSKSVLKSIELYDLIISLHCKQRFPDELVSSVECINIHPGFNPYNRGWYPQVFSIINKKQAGATIHLMDEEIDHGEIIDQMKVDVKKSDTSLDVYERVLRAEKKLIKKNLARLINGDFSTERPEVEGNYNSLDDFRSLCQLDLGNVATLSEHVDMLRALSHGKFKNAFFYDENGKKIFIRLSLEEESVSTEK